MDALSDSLRSSTCSIQCLNQRHPGPTTCIPPIPCTCWKYMWTEDYVLAYRKRQDKNHAILGIVPYCLCTLYLVYQGLFQYCLLLGLFEKFSSGEWAAGTFFVLWGGGCFVNNVSEGWEISLTIWSGGWGVNLSWGSRHIWSIVGRVLRVGDLVHRTVLRVGELRLPCVSWGWRGLKKMWPPRIISGTALRCRTIEVQVFVIN